MTATPPNCPSCGQPASAALAAAGHGWECGNEACTEFGQPLRGDEPPTPPTPSPGGDAPAG